MVDRRVVSTVTSAACPSSRIALDVIALATAAMAGSRQLIPASSVPGTSGPVSGRLHSAQESSERPRLRTS